MKIHEIVEKEYDGSSGIIFVKLYLAHSEAQLFRSETLLTCEFLHLVYVFEYGHAASNCSRINEVLYNEFVHMCPITNNVKYITPKNYLTYGRKSYINLTSDICLFSLGMFPGQLSLCSK